MFEVYCSKYLFKRISLKMTPQMHLGGQISTKKSRKMMRCFSSLSTALCFQNFDKLVFETFGRFPQELLHFYKSLTKEGQIYLGSVVRISVTTPKFIPNPVSVHSIAHCQKYVPYTFPGFNLQILPNRSYSPFFQSNIVLFSNRHIHDFQTILLIFRAQLNQMLQIWKPINIV